MLNSIFNKLLFWRKKKRKRHPLYKDINFWDAKLYAEKGIPQYKAAISLLQEYTFKGDENVLDVGCGPGNVTAHIAKNLSTGKVIGIDHSSNMIDYANQTYRDIKNLSFINQSVVDLNLKSKFNLITSFNTLHWVINQSKTLANIYQHLEDDGYFLYSMLRPMRKYGLVDMMNEIISEEQWWPYFTYFAVPDYLVIPKEDYEKLLLEAKFKIDFFTEAEYPLPFENRQEMAKWLESWMPHRNAIPPEKREAFFMQVADAYLARNNLKEVNYLHTMWHILVHK